MPLKLNIAMSRKVGAANYGSRGASVGLEMEVDSSLVDQPQKLHDRVARLFRLAKESVDRELAGLNSAVTATGHEMPVRPTTANQVRALHAIASRQNLDLADEVHSRFGVCRAEDLSLDQASQLIDAIKPLANTSEG